MFKTPPRNSERLEAVWETQIWNGLENKKYLKEYAFKSGKIHEKNHKPTKYEYKVQFVYSMTFLM